MGHRPFYGVSILFYEVVLQSRALLKKKSNLSLLCKATVSSVLFCPFQPFFWDQVGIAFVTAQSNHLFFVFFCSWLTVSHMLVCVHIFTVRLPSGGDISLCLTLSLTSVGVLSERRRGMNITRLLVQLLWRKIQDGASNGHISILRCATEVGKLSRCVGHVPQLRQRSGKQHLVHMNVQVIKKHPSCSAVLSECMMLISDC